MKHYTHGERECGICGGKYSQGEDAYDGDSVSIAAFAGMAVCESCFEKGWCNCQPHFVSCVDPTTGAAGLLEEEHEPHCNSQLKLSGKGWPG